MHSRKGGAYFVPFCTLVPLKQRQKGAMGGVHLRRKPLFSPFYAYLFTVLSPFSNSEDFVISQPCWSGREQKKQCCCSKGKCISACIAGLTHGSVSRWCITKVDIWLSQIGPDTQSRQRWRLAPKTNSSMQLFLCYILIERGLHGVEGKIK